MENPILDLQKQDPSFDSSMLMRKSGQSNYCSSIHKSHKSTKCR